MKTLFEYIEQLKDRHNIRIKLACECDDAMMDRIEQHLEKYDVDAVSMPSKTILQRRPLDFPQLDMAEVYIIDFTANLPVSTEMLRQELVKLLGISEAHINVRRADEPREQEMEQAEQEDTEEYQVRLGQDYTKEEGTGVKAEDLYGDKYNTGFLKELKKLRDERKKELKTPKIKDPDVPASDPELGDGKATNRVSPISGRTGK
jgi:hypothetical protein